MDAVTESGTLLVGTNTFAILTQSITDWVNFNGFNDDGLLQQTGMRQLEFEEIKEDYDGSDYVSNNVYDDSNYDIMEGQSVNEAFENIMAEQQRILAGDAQHSAAQQY